MSSDDDLKTIEGATFTGAEIKDAPNRASPNEYSDVYEAQFLEIQTSVGAVTMVNHVDHNGYYGGFAITCSD